MYTCVIAYIYYVNISPKPVYILIPVYLLLCRCTVYEYNDIIIISHLNLVR